jgi:lipoprotein-anchoring transpeptidase ErfK/SrfK
MIRAVMIRAVMIRAVLIRAVLALCLALPALAAQPISAASSPKPAVTVAKIVAVTNVLERPGSQKVLWRAEPQTRSGNASWLLVMGKRTTASGVWVRVLLPVRPNGTVGWIRANRVFLAQSHWRIAVSTGHRTLTLYRDGAVIERARVVVGAPATPTPRGLFALYDTVAQRDPRGFLGPWILHLTAFSNVLDDFGGGPGRIAIHGRGGSSLRTPLGSAASHGCIRVDNELVDILAGLPLGTPVDIR